MRINSKGQVTIPSELRHRHQLREGDEVEIIETGDELRIVRTSAASRGRRAVNRMRGRATTKLTTDEIMSLIRDE
jgi:AbrB family looped-hinge helix DNA binding protein